MSDWRNRGAWAQVMEEILQALSQSLERSPELPPSPPPRIRAAEEAEVFPALELVDQHLVRLQLILDQAEWQARETELDLAAAAEALRSWLGQEKSEEESSAGSP